MSKISRERSRAAAAYLKDHKIERNSGMCPWGCGRMINNGGRALIYHLATCQGKRQKKVGQ